jgi:hypothetical protein
MLLSTLFTSFRLLTCSRDRAIVSRLIDQTNNQEVGKETLWDQELALRKSVSAVSGNSNGASNDCINFLRPSNRGALVKTG